MPPDSSDGEIRLTAFAALRAIVEPTGGIVRREEMSAGFEFQGERIPFANQSVGIWTLWQFSRIVGAALSVTTIARRRGLPVPHDDAIRADGWFSYRYQGTDPTII